MQIKSWENIWFPISVVKIPNNLQKCLKRIRVKSNKKGKYLNKYLKKWARLYFNWYLNTEDDFLALKEYMFSGGETFQNLYNGERFYHILTMSQITNYDNGFSWSTLGSKEYQNNCHMMFARTYNNNEQLNDTYDNFYWSGRF